MQAGPAGVERREAPLRDEHRTAADGVDAAQLVEDRHPALVREDRAAVDVAPRIQVEGNGVAMFSGRFPHHVVRPERAAREAASEDRVVWIGGADRGAVDREIPLGDEPQEADLRLAGNLTQRRRVAEAVLCGSAALRDEFFESFAGAVLRREFGAEVEKASGGIAAAPPPAQLVVDEPADERRVVLQRRAALRRGGEDRLFVVGVEDVRESGRGGVLVLGDAPFGVLGLREGVVEVQRLGVRESGEEGCLAVGGEHVEAHERSLSAVSSAHACRDG